MSASRNGSNNLPSVCLSSSESLVWLELELEIERAWGGEDQLGGQTGDIGVWRGLESAPPQVWRLASQRNEEAELKLYYFISGGVPTAAHPLTFCWGCGMGVSVANRLISCFFCPSLSGSVLISCLFCTVCTKCDSYSVYLSHIFELYDVAFLLARISSPSAIKRPGHTL